tara:strand:- start:370 stop:2028 length:1659 start_codon:yes stop_codon:yes gene_type:complete
MPTLEEHQKAYKNAMADGNTLAAIKIKNIYENQLKAQRQQASSEEKVEFNEDSGKPEASFFDRSLTTFEKRQQSIEDTFSRPSFDLMNTPEGLTLSERAVRTAGDIAGGFGEIAGDAILTGLSEITPDFLLEGVEDAFKYIANTEVGREGLRLATLSADQYKEWASENRDQAKLLESYFNIGALITPATKIGKQTISKVGDIYEDTGGNLLRRGREGIRGDRREAITAMLEPESTTKVTGEDFEIGRFQNLTYNPKNPYTQENIDILTDGDIINPKKTYTANSNKLYKAAKTEAYILNKKLEAEDVVLNKNAVIKEINKKAQVYLDQNRSLVQTEVLTQANKVFGEAVKLIKEGDGSLVSLLKARQGVDDFVTNAGKKVNYENSSVLTEASKSVRSSMNELLERLARNTEVSRSLRKQSAYLNAAEILDTKIKKDARKVLSRVARTAGQYLPKTPLALAATAQIGAGLLFSTTFWPLLASGVVTSLVIFKGGKLAFSPKSTELLGKIIKDTGTAIKKADKLGHLDAVEQMKADRLVLISLLNEVPKEKEEKE